MANEVDSFLAGLDEKKDDPFKPETSDPFSGEVKPEVKVEEKEEEKPLPFNKDPKVQRFIEKQVEKRLAELKPTETERFVEETKTDEADEILTRIIGNDTPEKVRAIKDFKQYLGSIEEKGARKALEQLEREQEAERQEEIKAEQELSQGFENIEETFGVDITSSTPAAKKTRSEFVDFIRKVSPKDEDGNVTEFPDLEATFELFQERKKPEQPSRAKELASRGMIRSGDANNTAQPKDNSWSAVDKLFSRFSK